MCVFSPGKKKNIHRDECLATQLVSRRLSTFIGSLKLQLGMVIWEYTDGCAHSFIHTCIQSCIQHTCLHAYMHACKCTLFPHFHSCSTIKAPPTMLTCVHVCVYVSMYVCMHANRRRCVAVTARINGAASALRARRGHAAAGRSAPAAPGGHTSARVDGAANAPCCQLAADGIARRAPVPDPAWRRQRR